MPEIHTARRGRAQQKIAEAGADAALITSGPNVRYLTGLASSNAALLLAADGTAVLATDSRYTLAARRDCPDLELITERFIEARLADLGAERPAFATIVASGPNGAIPHHAPTDRPMRRGDLITMDFGALYGGYHADMTRTVALGEPAGWQREIYELVAVAQRSGLDAARPFADVGDVDAAARDLIRDAGHSDHFQHGLGHGVGLEVHEAPTIGYGRTGKLATRVPVTVEPGVYLPGRGGVRIEDVLVVGADGTGLLTTTTRELLVL